jgi:rhamnose transport system substrate-binding protein
MSGSPSRKLRFGVLLLAASAALAACSSSGTGGGGTAAKKGANGLDTGLKVYVIPKNLGNNYFTTSDSVKSGGALAALQSLGETGYETSGTAATPASQIPAIQAAITKGANILIVSATDPTALCPTLDAAMKKGIIVVTYDSDAPTCRDMFINQASTAQIGTSEVDLLASEIHDAGQIAIVSAAATATNQNAWITYMKQELAKYPKMQLVSTVYGNDDPTTATQVTQGLLEKYPNLKGIISPTTVGILAAAQVLSNPKYRGKIALTGLGTPDSLKQYVANGTLKAFELWNPANLGYLAAYAAVELYSKKITTAAGSSFTAGKLGKFTVGAGHSILLGPPFVFNSANISQFNFSGGGGGARCAPAPPGRPRSRAGRHDGVGGSRWNECASSAGSGRTGSMSTGGGTSRCGRR